MSNIPKIGALALLIGVTTAATSAHMQKSKVRLATIEHVMTGMVHPNLLAVENATKTSKKDQLSWKALATNATLLNEAGYLLVDDDRSLGEEWDNAAVDLRKASAAVLVQIDAHNINGISTELKAVNAACVRCHVAYRNQ